MGINYIVMIKIIMKCDNQKREKIDSVSQEVWKRGRDG